MRRLNHFIRGCLIVLGLAVCAGCGPLRRAGERRGYSDHKKYVTTGHASAPAFSLGWMEGWNRYESELEQALRDREEAFKRRLDLIILQDEFEEGQRKQREADNAFEKAAEESARKADEQAGPVPSPYKLKREGKAR